ncbi:hypothetical protein GQ43DRAFT_334611, partial [Delitschia confertaspora ATCC 74209]
MSSIEAAIKAIESLKPEETFRYSDIAKNFNVHRSTLSRRHRAVTTSHATKVSNLRRLSRQQEQELVRYIERLTKQGLSPTRSLIRNFASSVAKNTVGEGWVTRFINQNSIHLISKWTVGMDRNRHQADSGAKYSL